MKMCKAWADQKEYGRSIGYNQGEITTIMKISKLSNWTLQETITKLVEISGLSEEEAQDKVLNYKA